LHWDECPIPMILILRSNSNIFVWMFRYLKPRLDIEVECQMLFGWSKRGNVVVQDTLLLYLSLRIKILRNSQNMVVLANYFIPDSRNFHFWHKKSRRFIYIYLFISARLYTGIYLRTTGVV
jgi:hypothetical protein